MNNTSNLIDVRSLKRLINDQDVVILFTSISSPINGITADMNPSFIPNSMYFDFETTFADKEHACAHMLPKTWDFAEGLTKLGINNSSKIVVYDDQELFSAPRVWWMLKALGHLQVYVLNGGLKAWMDAGNTVTHELSVSVRSQHLYQIDDKYQHVISKSTLRQCYANSDVNLVDARGPGRFSGVEPDPRKGVRAGHIPHSLNLHYQLLVTVGKVKSKDVLTQAFSQCLENYANSKLIFSCCSGVTACILALAALEIGINDLVVSDGCWRGWGADQTCPVGQT